MQNKLILFLHSTYIGTYWEKIYSPNHITKYQVVMHVFLSLSTEVFKLECAYVASNV